MPKRLAGLEFGPPVATRPRDHHVRVGVLPRPPLLTNVGKVDKGDRVMTYAKALVVAVLFAIASLGAGSAVAEEKSAIFAGGCFWCMEEAFDKIDGVTATISGYTGGTVENPDYHQVSGGGTGHFEVVKVEYRCGEGHLCRAARGLLAQHRPFDSYRQFCDKGTRVSERGLRREPRGAGARAIDERRGRRALQHAGRDRNPPAKTFYPAEDYHQNFHVTNEARYRSQVRLRARAAPRGDLGQAVRPDPERAPPANARRSWESPPLPP